MNRERSSRRKETPFCTTRRFLLFSVVVCLAVVPLLYSRSASTNNVIPPPTPVIPLISTVPVVDLGIKNPDPFMEAPQTRSLKGVDDTTGEVKNASFLADVLPLKVLRILPSSQSVYSGSDSVSLYGRTALVVVFNRAVIPLGGDWEQYSEDLSKAPFVLDGLPPVPGKFRWVTTSIARFDPDVDWPTDLQFTLKIKRELKAYDGTPLTIEKHTILAQQYETPHMRMNIWSVDSPRTRNLTNGLWTSSIAGELHEVPPDAKITLHFTHPIDHDLVSKSLEILKQGSQLSWIEFTSEKCGPQCMHLTLNSDLRVDTEYVIKLAQGTQYHKYAGSLREEATANFVGLRSFKFDFTEVHYPAYNRYHLWLRHGLDPSTTVEQFQQAITIKEDGKTMTGWSLDRPHAAVLQITGNFKPEKNYTVSVKDDAEIKDGYGLSLQQSATSFKSAELATYRIEPRGYLFEKDFASDWEWLVRGKDDCSGVIVENIAKENVLAVLKDYFQYREPQKVSSQNPNYTAFPTKNSNYSVVSYSNDKIFGATGSAYARTICSWQKKNIIAKTDYAVTFSQQSDKLTAWVTSMSTGLPVSGATIALYDLDMYQNKNDNAIDSKVTDESGVATFGSFVARGAVIAVVTVGDSLLILEDVPRVYNYNPSTSYDASVFSDRAIYRLGETVYLKGYVNRYDMETLSPVVDANLKKAVITISWDQQTHVSVTVDVDPELGSFNASLQVPYTANYGIVSFDVQVKSDSKTEAWTSATITIADPRLPTSTLEMKIEPSTFKPQLNQIPVVIETKSYTGNPIPDAEVTLRWSVSRQYQFSKHSPWDWWAWVRPYWTSYVSQEVFGVGLMPTGEVEVTHEGEEETSIATDQGTVVIKTDATGKVEHKFTLPAEQLSRPVTDEDTIDFEVEWIGPTREKLTQSLSRRVAHSDWKLGVQLPTEEVVPGIEFDVFARLLDASQNDAVVEGQTVQLVLYEWDGKTPLVRDPATGAASLPFTKVDECKFASSADKITPCSFTLPEARQYVLLASTTDASSYSVVTAVPLGKSSEDWKHNPLAHLPTSHMIWSDKEEYENGETATVSFYAPYNGRALVLWGNQLASNSMQVGVEAGKTSVDIPIGQECFPDGCTVDVIVSVPRNPNASLPVEVPSSPLLDIGLPKQVHLKTVLKVAERLPQVLIEITPQSEVVRPGATTQLDISLTNEDNQPVSGELTVWLVDKSIFDLQPLLPPNFTQHFHKSFKDVYRSVVLSTEHLKSETALKKAKEIILRRLSLDHWVAPSWDLVSPSDLELSDEDYFMRHFGHLTRFPGSFARMSFRMKRDGMASPWMNFAGAPPMHAKSAVETLSGMAEMLLLDNIPPSAGNQRSPVIRSSANFVMTPVFLARVKVDATGKVTLPITLPDNIGTFKVFATAVSVNKTQSAAKLLYGLGESSIISRNPLSIQPSVPRIARLGDKFQAGVTVTVTEPESDSTDVQVVAKITQGSSSYIQLVNSPAKTVSVKQTQPVEVVFDFEAIKLGEAFVTFTAEVNSASGKYSDGLEISIPVLGLQEPVHVATSFSLDGKPATVASSQEGIKLPNAVPGSGNVTVEAGVGRLPAILMLSEGIFNLFHNYETGSTVLSGLAPKAALQSYTDGLPQVTQTNLAEEHARALEKIAQYTTNDFGLVQFPPRPEYPQHFISLWLNGMGLLQNKLMQKVSDVAVPDHLVQMWSRAFQVALADDINRGHQANMFWVAVFNYLYGPNAELPGVAKTMTSFSNLVAKLDSPSCNVACKALTALTIMDNSMTSNQKTLNDIIAFMESSIRVQGRTAYVTYSLGSGSAHAAGQFDNALALWTLSTYNYQTNASLNVLIEKVANYLGMKAAASGYYATDSAFVALSLSSYDILKGSTTPNIKVTVQSGSNILLSEVFDSPSDPVVKKQHSWDVLSDTVDFDAIGQGEVSIALGLSFIPSELFNTSIYRGIHVEKTIQLIDPFSHEPVGSSLTEVPSGKTVKVTLQITTPDDLSTVVLIDPVPAGLEPIDPNISPSAGMSYQFGSFSQYDHFGWWYPWYQFPKQYTMKDQVKFISTALTAGTHTVSYEALAVTSGTFTVPPAKAFVLNQPEVMGLSASGSLVVQERKH